MKTYLLTAALAATTLLAVHPALAYEFHTTFESDHYAVYEVILSEGDMKKEEIGSILSNDIKGISAQGGKYQTTAAIFPPGSKGLKSASIKEPLEGVVTYVNYTEDPANAAVSYNPEAKYASKVGIYMSSDMLRSLADNMSANKVLQELRHVPLIFTGMKVSISSEDYSKARYLTVKNRAFTIDFKLIDSAFYNPAEFKKIKPKCTVELMGFADRVHYEYPLFMGMHGVLNDYSCP